MDSNKKNLVINSGTDDTALPSSASRRKFLGSVGALSVAPLLMATDAQAQSKLGPEASAIGGEPSGGLTQVQRADRAFQIRVDAAQAERNRPLVGHPNNGDEERYPTGIATFSKSLPHNAFGEPDVAAVNALIRAMQTGSQNDMAAVQLGTPGGRRLVNPQAGLAFDLQGRDPHNAAIPPAPRFSSKEEASEMSELYWAALLRDVPFSEYPTNAIANAAAADLTNNFSDFRGPKLGNVVTPELLFRDNLPGCTVGPWFSQFLMTNVSFGSQSIQQMQKSFLPGINFNTSVASWLNIQNGVNTGPAALESTLRWMRNGRDIARFVNVDALYQAYFNALDYLLQIGAPWNVGNPYGPQPEGGGGRPINPALPGGNPLLRNNQVAFATFGGPFILALMAEGSSRALKAQWYNKWSVHRRLRPEAFGGRVHFRRTGQKAYPINSELLNSPVLDAIFQSNAAANGGTGTYLLSTTFPEGSPNHPAYGSGHAAVGGVCATILKAFFDGSYVLPNPVQPATDGLTTVPISASLTVEGELNKVVSNVGQGRNIAGVHWRTDAFESYKLGETIAISMLRELHDQLHEPYPGFTFNRFNGQTITV